MTANEDIPTSRTTVEHVALRTGLIYEALVDALERELGKLDPAVVEKLVAQKAPWSEVEREVGRMAGLRGLMIIFRADQGAITSLAGTAKRSSLYIVGNSVIANEIIGVDLRASFYVPFRLCVYDDGAPGGAVIAYDRPSSLLDGLKRPELRKFGELLDRKIDDLVRELCRA